jgi:hypothetical protein
VSVPCPPAHGLLPPAHAQREPPSESSMLLFWRQHQRFWSGPIGRAMLPSNCRVFMEPMNQQKKTSRHAVCRNIKYPAVCPVLIRAVSAPHPLRRLALRCPPSWSSSVRRLRARRRSMHATVAMLTAAGNRSVHCQVAGSTGPAPSIQPWSAPDHMASCSLLDQISN